MTMKWYKKKVGIFSQLSFDIAKRPTFNVEINNYMTSVFICTDVFISSIGKI